MVSVSTAMFLGDCACQQIEQAPKAETLSNDNKRQKFTILNNFKNMLSLDSDDIDHNVNNTALSSLVTANDFIYVIDKERTWNLSRSIRMGLTGGLLCGPISQLTWLATAKLLSPTTTITKKIIFLVGVAPINISAAVCMPSLLGGRTLEQTERKWRREILPTWILNSIFWPPAFIFILTKVREKNVKKQKKRYLFNFDIYLLIEFLSFDTLSIFFLYFFQVSLVNRGAVGSIAWFGWSVILSVVANRG